MILASSSPRRKELLGFITKDFDVLSPDVDEDIAETNPAKLVMALSKKKADAALERAGEKAVVIGADTVVVLDRHILGKPEDEADAARMLRMLSGRKHYVYTGFTVINGYTGKTRTDVVKTAVLFNVLSDEEIAGYIKTREPMDKAGAYGIQGYGSKFISAVNGDYFCVMGFPVSSIYEALKKTDSL